MIKTLIITGGNINKSFLHKYIKENKFDNIIAADNGLEKLDKTKITPNYIIGDFDSVNNTILDKYKNKSKIYKLNPEKDYTDTHMAIKLAIDKKSDSIVIIGATGTRIDHIIGNIHILKEPLEKGIESKLIDKNNEISLINKEQTIKRDNEYKYISLIPLTTQAKGITLNGFKYHLEEATLQIGESIGISNEQIEEKATIKVKQGILILIKSKD